MSISWNLDGSQFVTTCKDKIIRIIDARSGELIQASEPGKVHSGSKPAKCAFLGLSRIFTIGFSRHHDRQVALWNAVSFNSEFSVKKLTEYINLKRSKIYLIKD